MNFHELDNFNLDDAVKFHSRLNPRIWGSDEHLLPEVREKLQAIAADFQEFLGVDDLTVQDLTVSGSNAAYSYTPHSDIDLHLVVEMPDDPVYQELFNAKKYQYNDEHDIRIDGVPVELYVQPADQKHISQGIYSIKNGEWTQVPQRRRAKIDDSCVQHKAADLDARIHSAIKSGDADAINRLWDHIKQMRQSGLEKNGEFGCENITFKLLRNMGCIGRLKDAKTALRDRELSLAPVKKPRKRVNYGMRDYWYPGTAYAGQDHPAGTESEQVDEGERVPDWDLPTTSAKPNTNTAVAEPKVYAIGDSHGEGLSYTKGIINYAHGGQPSTSSSNYSGEYQGHPTGIGNVPDGSFVVISQGCNDAANSSRANLDSKGKVPLVPPETIANNVVRLVNAALAKRCKVVFVLFPNGDPNTRPYYGGPYQEKVRQAIKASVGVPVVDLEGSPLDASGVHAVSSAYKAAGSKVLSIFKTINEASSGPGPDHLKKILHRFYDSCVDKLKLKNPPRLHLETTPDWSRENGSFGQYKSENNTLILATAGRHVLDILRTMAHEMTHRQQDEREPLPIDAGETGSPWEDQANAMAGRIMRQWAEEQPEMFDGVTLEEASGYIPTKAQAKDPRFVMALTKDVRPGAVGREANKLGLQTDSQGHPALLTAGLQKLLREFKEQDLFEINMGGKNLRREAAKTGALAGMEFEMIVPNTQNEDEYDQEPDYDMDERASSPRDIRDFFYDGDFNSRRSVDGLIDSMMNDFSEWQSEAFDTRWESDSEQMIYDYIKDNMDDDDVRGLLDLEEEDPVGRNEYQLAADKITAEQIQPWYEDAQESARQEFYDNDDGFEEWLSDAELAYMSDIERRYSGDITWPHYRSVSSGEGASVQETAESFSQAVGRPARASDSYHAYGQERPAPGKNFYVVEPDGSLEPDDPDDAGLEFVSPPLPIDEIMSDLNKVKKWADLNGCYTNKSTGLHINISVPNYDLDRLDYVKLALLMGDEYVLESFGRAGNTYAKSAMGKVRDHVQKRPYEVKYLLDKMKGHMGELASKAIHSGSTEKYTSINTKDGHVEFRSPGGDWLGDNFGQIENTLLRFTVALSAAMDPKAYREEYLKKLYKILAPKDEKDPLAVFAKYAAGELPATALKSFVRQAQADRKAKKSGEAIVNGHRWRVTLKPELGGGVVEVMATDPIDAKKQAIIQQPNWRFVDDSALTVERLDEPAAGASTTQPHPEGRGRPNDPNGRLAIVNRDDPLVFAYGHGTPSPAPNYLFRFTLPDGYSQAQLRAVMAAWAARQNANAADYMVVDTTQFLAPAAPESASVQWNIIDRNNNLVHTFWNRNVQRDANAAAHEWLMANDELPSVDMQGPFDVIPAAGSQVAFIPGSTLDLQRQRQAADVAANTRRWADYEASQAPTPVAGVQDIEPDVEQYTSQPAQTQWEVYDRSTNQPVFRMYAADQAEAWRKGQEWVANYARMTPGQPIYGIDYSVRQSTAPLTESREITKLHKLDSVLEKCIEMIRRGHESDPERYGRVAACLIDNKNNHTYAINMPGPDGTRRHAERMAIDKHLQRHGRIGPNAIMITTLSPCVNHMDERYGESCTDLLSDYGIEKCYAGWQDPTQHPAEDYPFNLQVTDNADIFNTCKDIAASFLPQAMAEGTEQITWIKPNFDYEWDEIEFQAKQPQVPEDVRSYMAKHFPNKDAWLKAVQNGRAVVVPPDHGQKIRNYTDNKKDLLNALSPASHDPQGPAKAKRVNALFDKGGPIEMPIILKTSKGPWLIGGKTRLGTANLLKGIPAKVWMIGTSADVVPKQVRAPALPAHLPDHLPGEHDARLPYQQDISKPAIRQIVPPMIKEQNVDEAYTGPPMKFLRPGELSGGYSPQQMQAMGFKQTANGTWYIPVNTWQRLVSGGLIREGAPAVKNVVVPPPATSDILSGRVPAGPDQITHAYRNMSPAELQHALETGHFQANPNPGRTPGWSPDKKFWSSGDEQGHFGRDWKNADDNVRVRVPIDRVPANTAVDASHAQVLDKTTGRWTAVMPRSSAATAATPRSSSAATRLSRLGGGDDVNTFGFGSPAIDQQYIEDLKKEIAKNPGDPYNKNFQDEIDRIQKNMATTQLMREGAAGPLASMVSQDQDERNEYKQFVQSKAGGDWDKGAQMYAQLKGRPSDDIFGDSANQDRFMKMTFDFDTFTEDDWHNYWLMAQHCDKNRDFQRQALAAIEKYQGQDHQNYHYLADRISCGTTGTQKYGTQNGCNIDSVQENFADGRHPEDQFSTITWRHKRRKLNVPALINAGAILVTYPHSKQGWDTDDKEDWSYSLISLWNVLQGGWPSEAKQYLKPESYKKAEQKINSSAPNLGSDKLVYDGKYNQILWSIKKLGIPNKVAFLDDTQDVEENFADGRHPEDKGDSKRHHVPTKSSVSNLRRFAKSHSGRAAQLAHWMANMKAGRAKKK